MRRPAGTPVAVKVESRVKETPTTVTLALRLPTNVVERLPVPTPGQFVMTWIPGLDEVPMSVAGCPAPDLWTISVKQVGEATRRLASTRVGEQLGIRGPYGHGFSGEGVQRPLLVGGGVGMAPLYFLLDEFLAREVRPVVVLAAREQAELLYHARLQELEAQNRLLLECSTDDGSCGFCGVAHECLKAVIAKHEACDALYTCGPEKMMHAVFHVAEQAGVPFQASLERYMRCGGGVCGLCVLDPLGIRVCREGPVFDGVTLRQTTDFGRYARDVTGKKVPL